MAQHCTGLSRRNGLLTRKLVGPASECHSVMRHRQFTSFALFLLVSGCVPATFTAVPEIKGRVVDASGDPVPGAAVKVRAVLEPDIGFSLTCDQAGRFYRAEEAHGGLYILPMDNFGRRYRAVAVVDGQSSEPKVFGTPWSHVRVFGLGATQRADLGDLRLVSAATRP